MKYTKNLLFSLIIVLIPIACFSAEEDEVHPYEKMQDEYFQKVKVDFPHIKNYKTKHFSINYTMKINKFTKELPKTLEAFLKLFKKIMAINSETQVYKGRLEIYFWEKRSEYLRFSAKFEGFNAGASGGYFTITKMGWPRINLPLENNSRGIKGKRARALLVLFHEGTHALFAKYRTDVRLPTWLNEGLADYFAFSVIDKYYRSYKPMINAKKNHMRYIKSGLKSGNLRSFRDLFHQQGTSGGADTGAYALGWLSVSYLFKNHKKRFVKFLKSCKDSEVLGATSSGRVSGRNIKELRANMAKSHEVKKIELESLFKKAFNMGIDKYGKVFYSAIKKSPKLLKSL
ncbi:MAG: hypothetical protein COA79_00065 [Planctomycetota bacterium]|nr:MAG: hypothetical protein COA79_00065 [Planctomycetota bacterium]